MSVQEIENAVTGLSPEELAKFAAWFEEYQANRWDERIESDSRAGRFDTLIKRAKEQAQAGKTHPLSAGTRPIP